MKLGLKSKWTKEQLEKRIELNPYLIEIFVANTDLETQLPQINDNLKYLTENFPDIKLSIHQPEKYKNQFLNLATKDGDTLTNTLECLSILNDLSIKYGMIGFVTHPYWSEDSSYKNINDLITNLNKLPDLKNNLLLENELDGCFSTPDNIETVLSKTGYKFVLDVCHLRIASYNELTFRTNFELCKKHAYYFHLSDTDGVNDNALGLGKGVVNWKSIKKDVDVGLIEVDDRDYANIPNAINSYNYFTNL
jgi:sugar phosphate isomerase/epimerase